MNTMNVIIADDHPIVLFGIRKSLEQIEWVNVVGEFERLHGPYQQSSEAGRPCADHRSVHAR